MEEAKEMGYTDNYTDSHTLKVDIGITPLVSKGKHLTSMDLLDNEYWRQYRMSDSIKGLAYAQNMHTNEMARLTGYEPILNKIEENMKTIKDYILEKKKDGNTYPYRWPAPS